MYFRLPQAIVLLIFCASCNASENKTIASNVYRITKDIVAYGPRDPGSKGLEKVRSYLRGKVAGMGFVLQEQHFKANTPLGAIEMKNLYFDIPGTTSAMILLGAHYDSKRMEDMKFIGANDAASSVALLLGLSPWIKKQRFKYTVRVVLFDGEEAIRTWSSLDSLYGSKAYVQQIGEKESVKAAVIVDMISDEDLQLIRSRGSNEKLLQLLEKSLAQLSMQKLLSSQWMFVEDDHVPFIKKGIPTLHLMDYTFGGKNTPGVFWHTEKDDMSKVSKASLQTMTKLMTTLLPEMVSSL